METRKHFPALERMHRGVPVAYFDGPGGTQVPRQVAAAMSDYLFHHNANTHWAYPTSEETDAIIFGAREAAADFLHSKPSEISFGANMTTITFHLARALGRTWSAGDEVIVTDLDHHGNVAPWRALEVDRGIVVRSAKMTRDVPMIDFDHLEQLVSRKTKLIAIGGASNAVGTINDLARAAKIARAAGALFFVDAVHLAPHELVDVQRIGCDFLACSAYKFYGPHIGILFAREELLSSLPFPKLAPAPDTAPERAETGTQNQEGIAGVRATVDFLATLDGPRANRREGLRHVFATLHEQGQRHTRSLWEGLNRIPGLRLYGVPPSQPRTPTIAFTIEGMTSEEIARALAERAIFVSHGDFYAATLIERLGVEGVVRIGCACYTTDEEVNRAIEAVSAIARPAAVRS
ncbi:MAG: cysteine desulfurase-like protein [Thermoanaerobaculia bacterium]